RSRFPPERRNPRDARPRPPGRGTAPRSPGRRPRGAARRRAGGPPPRARRGDRIATGLRLAGRDASRRRPGDPSVTAALLAILAAHESSVSSSRLEFHGREVRATFTFSLEDLAGLARLDLDRNGTVEPDEWRRRLPGL